MVSKQKNPNIGMIPCQCCGRTAAVRKNKSEKLYYDCVSCGRITPNLPAGQNLILEKAVIWGEQGTPPAECPEWIANNWPWARAVRWSQEPPAEPAPGPGPGPAPAVPPGADKPPAPPPAKRARPRMPPPPAPASVKQEKPARAVKQGGGGFGFLEGW